MKIPKSTFNLILLLLFLATGCATTEEEKLEKERKKQATVFKLHLETNPDGTPYNAPVPVYRNDPIYVNVEKDPVLDEGFMSKAEVVDVDRHGGYAIKITFDETGTSRLENLTTARKGKRLAIYARWTEPRWLAAPRIDQQIRNGIFIFTPDASREESERIVNGLNNTIKKLKKPYVF